MPVGTQATVKGTTIDGIIEYRRAHSARQHVPPLHASGRRSHRARRAGCTNSWAGTARSLTDSGGYQVFSLASLRRLGDDGVRFRSHMDGSLHMFTPESVMTAQARIGADIIMSFDYFGGIPCPREEAERSVALTTAWAKRGRDVNGARFNRSGWEQVVFGIVQGAEYEDLRRCSAEENRRARFSRLRDRRTRGRRRQRADARHHRAHGSNASNRKAALFDGHGHAGGPGGRHRARRRHVRLRAADAQRPHR
jgi:queuine tRNA-ribosyltransferase